MSQAPLSGHWLVPGVGGLGPVGCESPGTVTRPYGTGVAYTWVAMSEKRCIHQQWSIRGVWYRVSDALCIVVGLAIAVGGRLTTRLDRYVIAAAVAIIVYGLAAETGDMYRSWRRGVGASGSHRHAADLGGHLRDPVGVGFCHPAHPRLLAYFDVRVVCRHSRRGAGDRRRWPTDHPHRPLHHRRRRGDHRLRPGGRDRQHVSELARGVGASGGHRHTADLGVHLRDPVGVGLCHQAHPRVLAHLDVRVVCRHSGVDRRGPIGDPRDSADPALVGLPHPEVRHRRGQ